MKVGGSSAWLVLVAMWFAMFEKNFVRSGDFSGHEPTIYLKECVVPVKALPGEE